MKALLLIDIQNDFVPGGALAVPAGDQVIPLANALQPHFELVVATQDWHPRTHKSFAANHPGKNEFETTELHGLEQVLWPVHCVQGTAGAELHPALDTQRIEAIFRKGTNPEIDSYSGLFDNGHQKATGLADYLRGKGVRQVYVAGLAGDYCVYFTAKDALQEGFETYLIEDAARPISAEGYERAKADIARRGGRIVHSSTLLG
ncbi:bifunctional nicotinamidase/pyrazinamidase [Hymenobacter latericus]|uniref:bifunctional nicotinamidase/pyrazinamidase n=1 Tax=Hymenobacter sp. YIM 151858-1 TaxID=2987688 RepID=UPI0022279B9D|nr:bifunctional nicotinamidase/pyrazinamidase [Hymenobacter sp. YIM 151858-1]UYZ60735.1 bifunctional nicotinamidase/pyrazinamidase [Hymenobacter sp. YIM 151858-1]